MRRRSRSLMRNARRRTNSPAHAHRWPVSNKEDVGQLICEARALAASVGFAMLGQELLATAVSELGNNIIHHAKKGHMGFQVIHRGTQRGIEVVAEDEGPGIPDIAKALQEEFSTADGLGVGLPGVKRMMDELFFDTARRRGTKICARKWA